MLQWGRALSSAESLRYDASRRIDYHASMGPRSVERGIRSSLLGASAHHRASMGPRSVERGITNTAGLMAWGSLSLQWGRALSSAESLLVEPDFSHVVRLQWGRALSSAESGE